MQIWRHSIRPACVLVLVLILGCDDVRPGWAGASRQPSPRPAGPPAGRLATPPADSSRRGEAGQTAPASPRQTAVPAPAAPSSIGSAARTMPDRSPIQIYQLILLSEAGPAEAASRLKHVRLSHARARDVANALQVLYLPSGPIGTDHRYTLVYPTALEHELAAQAAQILDVPIGDEHGAAEFPPDATAEDWWRWGVTGACRIFDDRSIPPERVRRVADTLATAASSSRLSRFQRWAAGMLAGNLLAHRIYDYAAADSVYQQIEAIAGPGSYEQMALLYARGRACQEDGRRDPARRMFESIVGQFSAMRHSEVFERARATLAEWDRRR